MIAEVRGKNVADPFDDTVPSGQGDRARIRQHDLAGIAIYGAVEVVVMAVILAIVLFA